MSRIASLPCLRVVVQAGRRCHCQSEETVVENPTLVVNQLRCPPSASHLLLRLLSTDEAARSSPRGLIRPGFRPRPMRSPPTPILISEASASVARASSDVIVGRRHPMIVDNSRCRGGVAFDCVVHIFSAGSYSGSSILRLGPLRPEVESCYLETARHCVSQTLRACTGRTSRIVSRSLGQSTKAETGCGWRQIFLT